MKKILAIAMALMLLVCFASVAVSAEEGYTAKLGFANSDWSAQEWGDNVNTTVTGPGTYTLTFNGAASDALVFVIDIEGAGADFAAAGYDVTALTVTADGVDVPVDLTKVLTGDLESNGKFRIEIYNEYGSTKADAPIDPTAVSFASELVITFTIGVPGAEEQPEEGGAEEQPEEGGALVGLLKYADADWWPSTAGDCAFEITGPGTYTITLENITATYGCGLDYANMFYIEVEGGYETLKDYVVSDVSIVVDGEAIAVTQEYVWTYESLGADYLPNGNYCIELYNVYGYSGAGYGAAIDPAIYADESIVITFTLTDPNAAPEPSVPDTGDAIFAVLSLLAVSGMGLTAVISKKK